MDNMYREIEIDLTTGNDCEYVLTLVNENDLLVEIYSSEFDGNSHMTAVLYVKKDNVNKLYQNNEAISYMSYDDYELDDESIQSLNDTKKATLDDIAEYRDLLRKLDNIHERYMVIP